MDNNDIGAKQGDRLLFHFVGRLKDGSVFAATNKKIPQEATLGNGELMPAMELGILGMHAGETRNITIMASDAYGPYNDELMITYPKQSLPESEKFEIGQILEMKTDDGKTMHAQVMSVDENTVTLDLNHPLAGKNLAYEIYLLSINGPPLKELLAHQEQLEQRHQAMQQQNTRQQPPRQQQYQMRSETQ